MPPQAGEDGGAEDKLRAYVHVFLERVVGSGRDSWIHRLMSRELVDPTPALDLIVQQAIRPRITYLRGARGRPARLPGRRRAGDRCAHSIHAQCVSVIPNPVAARLYPDFKMTPAAMAALAEHIAVVFAGRRPRDATAPGQGNSRSTTPRSHGRVETLSWPSPTWREERPRTSRQL